MLFLTTGFEATTFKVIHLLFVGMVVYFLPELSDMVNGSSIEHFRFGIGKPETFKNQLKPILSNERLFFTDLYKDGVGEKIEDMFREMIVGPGAVKATIHKYVK